MGSAEQGLAACTQQRSDTRHTWLDLLVQNWANSAADVQEVCWTNVGVLPLLKHEDQISVYILYSNYKNVEAKALH